MRFIFCSEPFNPQTPDPAYEREVQAVKDLALKHSLIDFEALVDENNTKKAVMRVQSNSMEELAIYRGWMLKPDYYKRLYEALLMKGLILINTPEQYKHCHYLPESFSIIEQYTPKSVWIKYDQSFSIDAVMRLLSGFGNRPIILKDYVKSRKHEWLDACYIPSAGDRKAVERVVNNFLQLQSEDVNEGLVFREFVEFEPLTTHSKSGMPLTKEYRLFILDGRPIFSTEYWDEGHYDNSEMQMGVFDSLIKNVNSRFFTMDVAKNVTGYWMIVELGDAQVAGLPERADIALFYEQLVSSL